MLVPRCHMCVNVCECARRAAPHRTAHTAHHIFWYSDLVLVVRLKNLYVSSIFVIACAQTCCD
jgi:hypothetical protein